MRTTTLISILDKRSVTHNNSLIQDSDLSKKQGVAAEQFSNGSAVWGISIVNRYQMIQGLPTKNVKNSEVKGCFLFVSLFELGISSAVMGISILN